MNASKVRQSLARILESVRDRGESIVIVRYGQPIAALVPMTRLEPERREARLAVMAAARRKPG